MRFPYLESLFNANYSLDEGSEMLICVGVFVTLHICFLGKISFKSEKTTFLMQFPCSDCALNRIISSEKFRE